MDICALRKKAVVLADHLRDVTIGKQQKVLRNPGGFDQKLLLHILEKQRGAEMDLRKASKAEDMVTYYRRLSRATATLEESDRFIDMLLAQS